MFICSHRIRRHAVSITTGIALAMLFFSGPVPAASFLKGPYLIYPGVSTQMTVLWQLDLTAATQVSWGPTTAYAAGLGQASQYNADHQQRFMMTNLTPDTQYYYRLQAAGKVATGTFHSAPAPDARRMKFLAYGDTRSNPADHNTVCGAIDSSFQADPQSQSLILHVGDWVSPGDSESAWDTIFFDTGLANVHKMLASLPILGCLGNHEEDGVLFRKYWPYPYASPTRFYWSYDYGPAHFTYVDQYDASPGPSNAQVTWIRNDLQTAQKRGKDWLFMIFHEPAYSAGGGHANNARAQQVLQPLCEQFHVSIVFSGHNHYYARCLIHGVQYLTLGGGGAPLDTPVTSPKPTGLVKAVKSLHFAQITIVNNSLQCVVLNPAKTQLDSFTITLPLKPKNQVKKDWRLYR